MNGIGEHKARLLEAHRIRWEPGFNDPTLTGWLTVAAYAAAAILAWRAAQTAARGGSQVERRFWLAICAATAFLAINKQLDLHVLVTDVGRWLAVQNDLYQQRRAFQKLFMAAIALAALAGAIGCWWITRGRDPALRLALAGLALCGVYILIRAGSFHHTDAFMRSEIGGARWNWAVELAGIAIVAAGAWRYRPRDPRRAR